MALPCQKHSALFSDRGGRNVVGEVTGTTLIRWERIRDEISEATIRIYNPPKGCLALLDEKIRSGRHELLIFRGDDRAWEGPLTRIAYASTFVELVARDVMHYPYRTIMRNKYDNGYPRVTTVTERMEKVLRTEMASRETLDPPINVLPYLDIRTSPNTARTARKTLPYQSTVYEDIDSMAARAGLDYTVIGRRIIGWDVHEDIGTTPLMSNNDFLGDVVVSEYGMELATRTAVTDGNGRWGAAGVETDPYYGKWEILNTSFNEDETKNITPVEVPISELRSQAARNLAGRNPVPVIVRVPDGSQLDPKNTSLTFADLVPGVRMPVRANLTARNLAQMQKLDRVRFESTPDGGETISVTMSPAPAGLPDELVESAGSGL